MLIKESKLRQIIKSVIRESIGMPPGGSGIDAKIEAMNLLKGELMNISGGEINMTVNQKVESDIENDEPCVYGSFSNSSGTNMYTVIMCDTEFRVSLDTNVDEIDIFIQSIDPSQIIADGGMSLASQVYDACSNSLASSQTRGGMGNELVSTEEDDWDYSEDDESYSEYQSAMAKIPDVTPKKPRYKKSTGYDPYDLERQYHQKELTDWKSKYGK